MVGENNQHLQNHKSLQIVQYNEGLVHDNNRERVWCHSRIIHELESLQPHKDSEEDQMRKAILDFLNVDLREDDETLKRLCDVIQKMRGNAESAEFVQFYLVDTLRLRFLSNVQTTKHELPKAHRNINIFKHTFLYLKENLKFDTYANKEIEKDHVKFMTTFTAFIGIELRDIIYGKFDQHTQYITHYIRDFVCRNYTCGPHVRSNYARLRTFTMVIKILHALCPPGFRAGIPENPFEYPGKLACINRFAVSEFEKCKECFEVVPIAPATASLETEPHQDTIHCSRKRGPSNCVPESENKRMRTHQSDQQGTTNSLYEIPPNENDEPDQENENIANQQAEVHREIKAEPDVDLDNQQAGNPDETQEQSNGLGGNSIQRGAEVGNEQIANRVAVEQEIVDNEQANVPIQNEANRQYIDVLLENVEMEAAWSPPSSQEYERARTKPPVNKDELDERINNFLVEINNGILPSTDPITEVMGSEKFDEEDLFKICSLVHQTSNELEDLIASKPDELEDEANNLDPDDREDYMKDAMSAFKGLCLVIVNGFASVAVTCVNEELGEFYRKFIRVAVPIMRYKVKEDDNLKEKADAVAKHFRLIPMGTSYPEMCCFNLVYRHLSGSEMTFEDGVDQEQNPDLLDWRTRRLYEMSLSFYKNVNKRLDDQQAENPDETQEQSNGLGENSIQRAAQVGNEQIANRVAVEQEIGDNEHVNVPIQNEANRQYIDVLLENVEMEAAWSPPSSQEYERARTKPPVNRDELDERINNFLVEISNGILPSTRPITEIMGSEKFDEEDLFKICSLVHQTSNELEDLIASKHDELEDEANNCDPDDREDYMKDAMSAFKGLCLVIVNGFASVAVTCINEELEEFYRKFIRVAVPIMRYKVKEDDNLKEKADAVAKHFRLIPMGTSYPEMCCFYLVYRHLSESGMTFEDGVDQKQNPDLLDWRTRRLYEMSLCFYKNVNLG